MEILVFYEKYSVATWGTQNRNITTGWKGVVGKPAHSSFIIIDYI